jgi:rhodanese-related sulfurtransferase
MATAGTRNGGCGDDGGGSGGLYDASSDEWEILRQACDRYVNEVSSMTITSKALFNNLDDNYTANDPYIISIRSSEHYELGHVPGAVNIPAGSLFEEENMEDLPTDKQIVVYCYTGQGAGHVSALLNINGYDAISLKFGMCSWTDNSTITADKCYDPATAGHNYRVSMGTDVGDWDTAEPAGE